MIVKTNEVTWNGPQPARAQETGMPFLSLSLFFSSSLPPPLKESIFST